MAQDDCLATGTKRWESKFKPTGAASFTFESDIEIKKVSNQLRGKHEKTQAALDDLLCDGTTMSFSRVETRTRPDGTHFKVRVKYKNGKFSGPTGGKLFINGTYEEIELQTDSDKQADSSARGKSATKGKSDRTEPDTGDWQAEKPVA
jgi:hypothetical protein